MDSFQLVLWCRQSRFDNAFLMDDPLQLVARLQPVRGDAVPGNHVTVGLSFFVSRAERPEGRRL